ncbi:uncharacterized protein [Spinacia oleracea]|uniref:Uncharacterized protein isoform X4 n=1 Tax=Spinacia oleracea TaxID=3562 RepID=A0ABM3QUN0_SPIOL|nr:uncharacterized protein LOC110784887 isoform X4 [Spinacia oleracea]
MAMNSPTAYLAIAIFVSLSSIFSTVTSDLTEINAPHLQTHQHCSNSDNSLACEIQEMKFKVARLELLSETTSQELYTKSLQIGNCDKKIEELSRTIHNLESDLSNLKDAPDYEEIIKLLEEQVRELEADVRRNDKNLHHLKVKAEDDKKSVELLASKVETMAKIVPELWFHVQKLEQACEVIERRTGELRRHLRNQKCSFFKFINKLPVRHYQKMVVPYTSKALHQLRRSASVAKKYHHQEGVGAVTCFSIARFCQTEDGEKRVYCCPSWRGVGILPGFYCSCFPYYSCFEMAIISVFSGFFCGCFPAHICVAIVVIGTFSGFCCSCFLHHFCFEMIVNLSSTHHTGDN